MTYAGTRRSTPGPLLVLATVIGLSVEDLSEAGGPFLGVNDVEFVTQGQKLLMAPMETHT